MNGGDLRISNYNYNATVLLERVRGLLARDERLLGEVVQRSALMRSPGSDAHHVMTKIEVLPKSQVPGPPAVLDYSTLMFVTEVLSKEDLLSRLSLLAEKRFQVGINTISSTSIGFSDRFEPSRNSYSEWPCTVFDVHFGHAQLSSEPLLHSKLKSFSSVYDAIQEFLKVGNFNGSSDSRLGRIQLALPNLNARIESLALSGKKLHVQIGGSAPIESLKITVSYKNEGKNTSLEQGISQSHTEFELASVPTELRVWLISTEGFVADFHDENLYYSAGANAVLPKKQHPPLSDLVLSQPPDAPGQKAPVKDTRRAVILTALSLEYKAVRAHLENIRERTHPRGTVYEVGEFRGSDGSQWEVCIVEAGAGNPGAARETERAISQFDPEIAAFVGVAGGLKDVSIGDIVVATKVYGYESGKAQRAFRPRPQVYDTAYELQQRARAEAKREDWFRRVGGPAKRNSQVFVGPIASGEKVLASHRSALSKFLGESYGDALAIDMEALGFLEAVHASHDVRGLIVRGISDLIEGKSKADAHGSQIRAARCASAFTFEVLSKLAPRGVRAGGAAGPEMSPPTSIAAQISANPPAFHPDARVDELIKNVRLGDRDSTVEPAVEIIRATDASGSNELFQTLLNYQDCQDQDALWKALPTIEACVEFAPHLVDHAMLNRMAENPDFSVRSSAASICMDLAQFAPDRVPVHLLIRLSVYSEDWYVESPANAALKAMARSMPAVLRIFFMRLRSQDAAERAHAARALAEIAGREPEILDPDELRKEISRLKALGDGKAATAIAKVLPKVQRAPRLKGYKYGL